MTSWCRSVARQLEGTGVPPARSDGRTVADALDAWTETYTPTWAASTVRDQTSRAPLVKADKMLERKQPQADRFPGRPARSFDARSIGGTDRRSHRRGPPTPTTQKQ